MRRPNHASQTFRAILGLVVALGLGAARSEKIWAEALSGLDLQPTGISVPHDGHEPFDPARVPPSGGMAARLLSGIGVKHA